MVLFQDFVMSVMLLQKVFQEVTFSCAAHTLSQI